MAHAIRMPKPGQMTEECTLLMWRKGEGDTVHRGDVLFEIETDKSAMEVEAFDDGVLLRQVVAAGETVPVNAVCGWVGDPGDEIPVDGPPATGDDGAPPRATDAAAGGPPAGAAAMPAADVPAAAPMAAADRGTVDGLARGARISPRALRLAGELGVDIARVHGTGPGGRLVERDIRAAAGGALPAAEGGIAAAAASGEPVPPPAVAGEVREPLGRMRRVIAERLARSWTTSPHFTVTVAVDASRLLARLAAYRESGAEATLTDLLLVATARTLREYPDFSARIEGAELVRRAGVHLGLAVSVPGGLLVPVIRDADHLSVHGMHERTRALIEGARQGTLGPDELSGSTFTVSNLGMFGVDEFSAIINPGEAGILAVASAVPTPVVAGGGIAVRPVMKLTLSADHRIVDGEVGARFLGSLRARLESDASDATDGA